MTEKNAGAGQLIRHSSIYAVGGILRQLVGFIMLPIYTRYLTPADYGVIALLVFGVSLIELVFGARLGNSLPKFYYEQKTESAKSSVISTALFITGTISFAAMVSVLMLRVPTSEGLFGTSEFSLVVSLFSIQILTNALEHYGLIYLRIQQRPYLLIAISVAKLFIQLSFNIVLVVVLEMGVLGVAIGSAASSLLFAAGLAIYTIWCTGVSFKFELAKQQIAFCWPLWLGGLAGLYIGSSNRIYIRIFGSLDEIGLFELAAKFSSILVVLLWSPFMQYWQTERFSYYNRGNAQPVFQMVFQFISTLMIIGAVGLCLFAVPVIHIMADEAFHTATRALPFLAFGGLFAAFIGYFDFSLLAQSKTIWIGKNNYLTAAIITVFYLLLIPPMGFVGAAMALALGRFVQFCLVYRAAKKNYDMGIPLNPILLMTAIAFIGIYISNEVITTDNPWVDLIYRALATSLIACLISAVPLANPDVRKKALDLLVSLTKRRTKINV